MHEIKWMKDKAHGISSDASLYTTKIRIAYAHKSSSIFIQQVESSSSAASQHGIVENQVDYFYNGETAAADQQSKVSAHITYK